MRLQLGFFADEGYLSSQLLPFSREVSRFAGFGFYVMTQVVCLKIEKH